MTFRIREATLQDAGTIADFNNQIARETEHRSLDPGIVGPGVEAILADATKGRYWVAHCAGAVVGQIMVTYEWSDWRNATMWWIESVYVHPDHRRRGVFSALYRHVESIARSQPQVCGLRLYVEEQNRRAQDTYHSLGMNKPGYIVMQAEFHETGNEGASSC
jgi:ribosomal protein S18 acetylase RimI-like enzyme